LVPTDQGAQLAVRLLDGEEILRLLHCASLSSGFACAMTAVISWAWRFTRLPAA